MSSLGAGVAHWGFGQQSLFEHDDLGRVVKLEDDLGQQRFWVFGPAGRLSSEYLSVARTEELFNAYFYYYDEAATHSPIETLCSQNLLGKLSWIECPVGEEHRSYDSLGRVATEATVRWDPSWSSSNDHARDEFLRHMTYQADGAVVRRIAPGGLELDLADTKRGQVMSIVARKDSVARSVIAASRYDQRGWLVESENVNGVHSCRYFTERGELVGDFADKTTSPCRSQDSGLYKGIWHLRYVREFDGLLGSIVDASLPRADASRHDAEYEYDGVNQLVAVRYDGGETRYGYDNLQNLVSRTIADQAQDRSVGAFEYGGEIAGARLAGPNAITAAGGQRFEYDAIGQMLRYHGYDLLFELKGRLVEASNVDSGVRDVFFYDDAGQRRIALVYRLGKPVELHRFVAFAGASGAQVVSGSRSLLREKGKPWKAIFLPAESVVVDSSQAIWGEHGWKGIHEADEGWV
ncbi:MAG: hypothetical protein MK135_17705, partial [Polyangiaceae bacterium]|nr:hypothetical protein [Polyangiaceae bacterium]